MKKTAYIFDNIVVATKELETLFNDGYEIVSSTLYQTEFVDDKAEIIFAAVLVKEVN